MKRAVRYRLWIARLVGIGGALGVLTAAAAASASPQYPCLVVAQLMLPQITIDPGPPGSPACPSNTTNGCKLCHNNDSGGFNNNNAFGLLLKSYGLQPEEDQTLTAALDKIATDNPNAISDIKMGVSPADDPAVFSNNPVPEYGCQVGEAGRTGSAIGFMGVSFVLAMAFARRLRAINP
jgi:hypothetical protein